MAKKTKKIVLGHKCPNCNKKFKHITNLNIHWKKIHQRVASPSIGKTDPGIGDKAGVKDIPKEVLNRPWPMNMLLDDLGIPSDKVQEAAEMIVRKSQLLINIAAELGIPISVCKLAEVDVSELKGIPVTPPCNCGCQVGKPITNREWGVHVHFMVSINSPVMPDEDDIKRAIRTKLIYNAETDRALEEFIEDMDWDDPQTSI